METDAMTPLPKGNAEDPTTESARRFPAPMTFTQAVAVGVGVGEGEFVEVEEGERVAREGEEEGLGGVLGTWAEDEEEGDISAEAVEVVEGGRESVEFTVGVGRREVRGLPLIVAAAAPKDCVGAGGVGVGTSV